METQSRNFSSERALGKSSARPNSTIRNILNTTSKVENYFPPGKKYSYNSESNIGVGPKGGIFRGTAFFVSATKSRIYRRESGGYFYINKKTGDQVSVPSPNGKLLSEAIAMGNFQEIAIKVNGLTGPDVAFEENFHTGKNRIVPDYAFYDKAGGLLALGDSKFTSVGGEITNTQQARGFIDQVAISSKHKRVLYFVPEGQSVSIAIKLHEYAIKKGVTITLKAVTSDGKLSKTSPPRHYKPTFEPGHFSRREKSESNKLTKTSQIKLTIEAKETTKFIKEPTVSPNKSSKKLTKSKAGNIKDASDKINSAKTILNTLQKASQGEKISTGDVIETAAAAGDFVPSEKRSKSVNLANNIYHIYEISQKEEWTAGDLYSVTTNSAETAETITSLSKKTLNISRGLGKFNTFTGIVSSGIKVADDLSKDNYVDATVHLAEGVGYALLLIPGGQLAGGIIIASVAAYDLISWLMSDAPETPDYVLHPDDYIYIPPPKFEDVWINTDPNGIGSDRIQDIADNLAFKFSQTGHYIKKEKPAFSSTEIENLSKSRTANASNIYKPYYAESMSTYIEQPKIILPPKKFVPPEISQQKLTSSTGMYTPSRPSGDYGESRILIKNNFTVYHSITKSVSGNMFVFTNRSGKLALGIREPYFRYVEFGNHERSSIDEAASSLFKTLFVYFDSRGGAVAPEMISYASSKRVTIISIFTSLGLSGLIHTSKIEN